MHDGKIAVVTGGAEGIGLEIAVGLAAQGAGVAIIDNADPHLALQRVKEAGGSALGFQCDVTDVDAVRGTAEQIRAELGTASILINNTRTSSFIPFTELDLGTWRQIRARNLDSLFIVSSAFVPHMRIQKWGRVVNVAANTFLGGVIPNYTHFVASMGGVVGFTRALAAELGPDGITVNAVAPGFTQTADVGGSRDPGADDKVVSTQAIKRRPEPDDIVGAVSFLSSESAGFITSQTLPVDGGVVHV